MAPRRIQATSEERGQGRPFFYGHTHPNDYYAKRVGIGQNNARAELRAVLFVVPTPTEPTWITSDCRSVVDGVHHICDGQADLPDRDQDLWRAV